MTKSPHPSSVDKGELLPVTQADREAIDRAERFAKSTHTTPEEHDDIMVAVRVARQAHSLPRDVGMLTFLRECVEEARSDHVGYHESNKPGEPDTSKYDAALQYLAALTPSALSEEQQWGGLLEDGLCDDHGQFMCPKCRYPVPSQQGTEP